jgi:hypothetical protein
MFPSVEIAWGDSKTGDVEEGRCDMGTSAEPLSVRF